MDASDSGGSSSKGDTVVKVARLIEEFDLDGLGDELEWKWTTDEPDRMSLRELADLFNRRLLDETMRDAGVQPIDGEGENVYRLLTAEDTETSDRIRARRRLERDGIDVDKLESDFVSYQAVRTYLTEMRDAEYTSDSDDRIERDTQSIQELGGRIESIAQSKLERLRDAGHITLGDARVMSDVAVLCQDCGAHRSVPQLLDQEGCDCSDV